MDSTVHTLGQRFDGPMDMSDDNTIQGPSKTIEGWIQPGFHGYRQGLSNPFGIAGSNIPIIIDSDILVADRGVNRRKGLVIQEVASNQGLGLDEFPTGPFEFGPLHHTMIGAGPCAQQSWPGGNRRMRMKQRALLQAHRMLLIEEESREQQESSRFGDRGEGADYRTSYNVSIEPAVVARAQPPPTQ